MHTIDDRILPGLDEAEADLSAARVALEERTPESLRQALIRLQQAASRCTTAAGLVQGDMHRAERAGS